jgi:hypothetical protein
MWKRVLVIAYECQNRHHWQFCCRVQCRVRQCGEVDARRAIVFLPSHEFDARCSAPLPAVLVDVSLLLLLLLDFLSAPATFRLGDCDPDIAWGQFTSTDG